LEQCRVVMKKKFGRIESQSSLRTLVTGPEKLRPAETNSSLSPMRTPKRSAIQCSIEIAPRARSSAPNHAPSVILLSVGSAAR